MNISRVGSNWKFNPIETITTNIKLMKAISYLKDRSNWSEEHSKRLYSSLISKKENSFYGVILKKKDGSIGGAILTSYQGLSKINEKHHRVFNMFSWYVDKSVRGYKSIILVKRLLEELSDSIITNVSPNQSAYKILKPMGFIKGETYTTNFYILEYILNCIGNKTWRNDVTIEYNPKIENSDLKLLNLGDSKVIKLKSDKDEVDLIICRSKVFRSVFGKSYYIPRFHILWASSPSILEKNYNKFLGFLFFKFKTPIVSCHCLNLRNNYSRKIWRYHLYKSPLKSIDKFPIIGSEYSIKF